MAYAVNHDVVKSMDALETATEVEPTHSGRGSNTASCTTAFGRSTPRRMKL